MGGIFKGVDLTQNETLPNNSNWLKKKKMESAPPFPAGELWQALREFL